MMDPQQPQPVQPQRRVIRADAEKRSPLEPIGVLLSPLTEAISKVLLAVAGVVIGAAEYIFELLWRVNSRFVKFSEGFRMRMGKRFSKKSKNTVGMMVVYAGLTRNPEEILGIMLIYSIGFSMLTAIVASFILQGQPYMGLSFPLILIGSFIAPFIAAWVLFYVVFMVLMDRRTSAVEKVLPDVLTIISQNMIAGMTVYNSLWTAARPEFGPLAVELQSVARETLGGESFEKSLMAMSGRIKSYKLARAVKLMIQGMRSGGELPTVLQEIATDIRVEQALIKKMSSQTTSQVLFIVFAILVGAPLLFSASLQFVGIFNGIYDKIGLDDSSSISGMSSGMVSLQKLPITEDFFYMYSIITLAVLGLFGALLMGMIKTGRASAGVPLMPIIMVMAILIFVGLTAVIGGFFKGMLG